jgi:hypothetical protein
VAAEEDFIEEESKEQAIDHRWRQWPHQGCSKLIPSSLIQQATDQSSS